MGDLTELAKFASENMESLMFYILAFLTIPFAFGVLLDKHIIRAGFLLIGVFGGISGLFLLLQAQFLAMAQMMIYAVGITLVVVIALMLTNPKLETDSSVDVPIQRLPALTGCTILFLVMYMAGLSGNWPTVKDPLSPNNIETLGREMLTNYSLPFEFASILLLVALIGAVMLAKADHFHKNEEILDKALDDDDLAQDLASLKDQHKVKI